MKPTTKLEITFAPIGKLNLWAQPIRSNEAKRGAGARISVRFTGLESSTAQHVKRLNFQAGNGITAERPNWK